MRLERVWKRHHVIQQLADLERTLAAALAPAVPTPQPQYDFE